jgi:hypothetical protein
MRLPVYSNAVPTEPIANRSDVNICVPNYDEKKVRITLQCACVMSKITGLVCWMDSKLKLDCLTLVPVMCYKYVGSITVLPAEIGYDRLT